MKELNSPDSLADLASSMSHQTVSNSGKRLFRIQLTSSKARIQ